jgi:transmembrane sensor
MSEANNRPEELIAAGDADQIEERAAEWIEHRDFGDWDEYSQRELDAWLAQSIAHRVAFVRLDFEWQRTERLTILRGSEVQSAAEDSTGRIGYFAARFAALMLFVTIIAGATVYLRTPRDEIYATSIGGHKTVTFSDGSQIELNTDTVLRVNMADNRKVRLEKGEAYFQIEHDATHPFVVKIADHTVTDLGTKFLLRSGANGIELALVEGRARIDSANFFGPKQSATLKAGDVAVATAAAISVARASTDDLANELGWRRGMLVFHHATLEEAADQYNRYSAKHIVIADSKVGRMIFSATLPSNNVDTFIRVAEKLFNIHSQDRGDEIVISR